MEIKGVPGKSRFGENLIFYNGLDKFGFREWCFYEGMLLNNPHNWWGTPGYRHSNHEGLDLCLYRDGSGEIRRFGEEVKIPVMYDGRVVAISSNDFLGKSLYVGHGVYDGDGRELHTVYAHVEPCDGVETGQRVSEGDIIAGVVNFKAKKAKMLPHVHLSMAWIPETFPPEELNWTVMGDPAIVGLCDPLEWIASQYTTMKYRGAEEFPNGNAAHHLAF